MGPIMENISRVPRTDTPETSFVLLRITQTDAHGDHFTIIGTDGDLAFRGQVDDARTRQMRAPAYKGSPEEWQQLVHRILLKVELSDHATENDEVGLVAQLKEDKLHLVIRQLLEGGISVRLGHLELRRDDALLESIELFDWTATAVAAADKTHQRMVELESQLDQRSAEREKLRECLEQLIEAKKTHEHELLTKFRQLLNAKKMKIRDQQRLLAGAKIDPEAAVFLKSSNHRTDGSSLGASPNMKTKRKPNRQDPDQDSNHDDHETDQDHGDRLSHTPTPESSEKMSDDEETLPHDDRARRPQHLNAEPAGKKETVVAKNNLLADEMETDDDKL